MRKLLTVVAIAVPLTFAACGEDDDDSSGESAGTTSTTTEAAAGGGGGGGSIDVSETEFALDPSEATVEAGEVTITATNDGATVHNLEVEGNGVEEITDDLEPGASDELTLELEPGTYEMYCAIGTHADQGMEGEITVE